MRSQNIKYNSLGKVGGASCLLLFLLSFLTINPITSLSAFAEENAADEADAPVAQADIPSTVGISFSPAKYYAELSPTDNAGQSARIDLQTTVYVYNSGGYSVYIKSDSPNLVGEKNSDNFIPGATVAKVYADMDVNTWGYAWSTDAAAVPSDVAYKAITVSGSGDKLAENTDDDIEVDTKTIALSFATRINDEMPADTYSNTMTLSVVSSPAQMTFAKQGVTIMQQMTPAICDAVSVGQEAQLKDIRDGKYYWVSKLADGKCWMTQNLDLDLSTETKLTSDTSDVPADGYTPKFDTATIVDGKTILASNTGERSWSLGDVRVTNPNIPSDCGHPKNSAANCPAQFTAYSTPQEKDGVTPTLGDEKAHYVLGNHYQWNVATVSTGGSTTSDQATNSICPKGWRLPTSNTVGEFEALVAVLGDTGSTGSVTMAPFYGVRGGGVSQDTAYLFDVAGANGYYWSSTPNSSDYGAYCLGFGGTDSVELFNSTSRQYGFSVRCVAR